MTQRTRITTTSDRISNKGTTDLLATPYHHRQLADGIPGAKFAEIVSGHLPFVECPAEWLALIREFLDDVHT